MSPVRAKREGHELNYQSGMRSAARGLWAGETNWFEAVEMMITAIQSNFTRAWADGLSSCGITLGEQTPEEAARLQFEINSEIQYVYKFSNWVEQNSRAHNGSLKALYDRVDMWTNRYTSIRDIAMTYACGDEKLQWVMGYTKEHCVDCQRLNGRIYRRSVWRAADLYPKKHSLNCGGYRCACQFVKTNAPATPGFPPRI